MYKDVSGLMIFFLRLLDNFPVTIVLVKKSFYCLHSHIITKYNDLESPLKIQWFLFSTNMGNIGYYHAIKLKRLCQFHLLYFI